MFSSRRIILIINLTSTFPTHNNKEKKSRNKLNMYTGQTITITEKVKKLKKYNKGIQSHQIHRVVQTDLCKIKMKSLILEINFRITQWLKIAET